MITDKKMKISLTGNNSYLSFFKQGAESLFFTLRRSDLSLQKYNRCREVFSYLFQTRTAYIGFAGGKINLENLNNFFNIIETRLGLQKRTVFYKTNHKFIIVCEIPTFWRENTLRRQFFTMFLRFGALFFKGNFDADIEKYPLTKATKNAIIYFLNGHVNPKDKTIYSGYNGIVHLLGNQSDEEIKKKLGK